MSILNEEIISKSLDRVFSTNFSILMISNIVIFGLILFKVENDKVYISLIFPIFSSFWFLIYKTFDYLKFKKEFLYDSEEN